MPCSPRPTWSARCCVTAWLDEDPPAAFAAVWSPVRLSPVVVVWALVLASSVWMASLLATERDDVSAVWSICWSPFCAAVWDAVAELAESLRPVLALAWSPARLSPVWLAWTLEFSGNACSAVPSAVERERVVASWAASCSPVPTWSARWVVRAVEEDCPRPALALVWSPTVLRPSVVCWTLRLLGVCAAVASASEVERVVAVCVAV